MIYTHVLKKGGKGVVNRWTGDSMSEILIYEAESGQTRVDVRLEAETVWLSLNQMSGLFGRDKSVISRHLRNIFQDGELVRDSVVAFIAITAAVRIGCNMRSALHRMFLQYDAMPVGYCALRPLHWFVNISRQKRCITLTA